MRHRVAKMTPQDHIYVRISVEFNYKAGNPGIYARKAYNPTYEPLSRLLRVYDAPTTLKGRNLASMQYEHANDCSRSSSLHSYTGYRWQRFSRHYALSELALLVG